MPDVQINTDKSKDYGGGFFKNKVAEENPWDPLSKAFKKYTHAIQYISGHYSLSDYNISVYTKGLYIREFEYKKPNQKVIAVEVYFKVGADITREYPLILGFVYDGDTGDGGSKCNKSKCYYIWSKLKSNKQTGTIKYESFGEKDLVTRLLEEIGPSIGRTGKLVIRLDEQPGGDVQTQYPESGYNQNNKITVRKGSEVSGAVGYNIYEHSVPGSNTAHEFDDYDVIGDGGIEDLYVSYENNSRFFKAGTTHAWVKSVDAYFDTLGTGNVRDVGPAGGNSKRLVLITFNLTGGTTLVYSYSDFVQDLKDITAAKKWSSDAKQINGLKAIGHSDDGSDLPIRLEQEKERLRPLITFVNEDPGPGSVLDNQNITTSGPHNIGTGTTFKKVALTPNTKDEPGGSSVGPWKVCNGKLLNLEPGKKIDDKVLSSITTNGNSNKYKSITVFYTSDDKALLVEFNPGGCGRKTYFKRVDEGGNKWESANRDGINTVTVDGGTALARKLIEITTAAFNGPEGGSRGDGVGSSGDSRGSTTTTSSKGVSRCNTAVTGQQKEIQIEINEKGFYRGFSGGVLINVTKDDPWDTLSKAFKKYTHAIQYTGGGYDPSQYKITVYGQSGSGFTLNSPNQKVIAVEVYFNAIDAGNKNPLILGFIYEGSSVSGRTGCGINKCFYTWANLKSRGQYDCTIDVDESITEKDLVTMLLEIGSTVIYRKNKLVIRLDEKPAGDGGGNEGELRYPDSGIFKNSNKQVTVKKVSGDSSVTGLTGFEKYDKYEHTFNGISGFGDGIAAASPRKNDSQKCESGPGAKIISSSNTMMTAKEIEINTKTTTGSYSTGGAGINVSVSKDDPWDPLSKIFKKYTHTIGYPRDVKQYDASKYTIRVYYKDKVGSGGISSGIYGFTLNTFTVKVNKVEVYFKGDDIHNKTPLIVGFIYDTTHSSSKTECNTSGNSDSGCSNNKCYYTWSVLTTKAQHYYLAGGDWIKEQDLLTRLLEQIGTTAGRRDKLVIRLDEKPNDGEGKQYPDSGYYSVGNRKITLKKARDKGVPGVEGYEHTVGDDVNAEEFYVTYWNDSRYFKIALGSRSEQASLEKVTAYFETGTGGEGGRDGTRKLVLFVMSISRKGLYVYSYHDFVNDLKKVTAGNATKDSTVKIITKDHGGLQNIGTGVSGGDYSDSALKNRLEQEKERLRPFIEFVKGAPSHNGTVSDSSSSGGNEHIRTKQHNVGDGNKFIKVVMTPDTSDDGPDVLGDVRGSPAGPWTVYNDYLIGYESDAKIQDDQLLTDIFTGEVTSSGSRSKKYKSIGVFYSLKDGKNYKALLIEFVKSDGTKTYFKRVDEGGNKWDNETISGDVDAAKLIEIATPAKIIVSSSLSVSIPDPIGHSSPDSQDDIQVAKNAGIATGATVIIGEGSDNNSIGGSNGNARGGDAGPVGGSSESTTMMTAKLKEIQIETHGTGNSYKGGYISNITVDDSWDPLSRAFKKYIYAIKYPAQGDGSSYNASNYTIKINGPHNSTFTYKEPKIMVQKVEVYFRATDKSNTNPLIVGFITQGGSKYYTWSKLKNMAQYYYYLVGDWISEKDLITGLLEEVETLRGRKNKFVIRLDEKPAGDGGGKGEFKYPDSGFFKDKIKVKKQVRGVDTVVPGYDGYEHEFGDGDTVSEFYVSYLNNSRHIKVSDTSEHDRVTSVTVYYETTTTTTTGSNNSKNPVLITFTSTSGSIYLYTYYDFVKDLKGVLADKATEDGTFKTISDRDAIRDGVSGLPLRLAEESERLRELISFEKRHGSKNENVTTQSENINGGGEKKFKKITLTPNTTDGPDGSSVGPWNVYKNHLFTSEPGVKIQEVILSGITGSSSKYSSISVYYTKDNKALLVEFDPGIGVRKKYIKRKDADGNTWESANRDGIDAGNSSALVEKLTQIGIAAFGGGARGAAGGSKGDRVGSSVDSRGNTKLTDQQKEIRINTYRRGGYTSGHISKIIVESPWDPLSKIFKKYTHNIKYPEGGGHYVQSNYKIKVYGPDNIPKFTYKEPKKKVFDVEIYFMASDNIANTDPLILGFIYEKKNKCYYTWTYLARIKECSGTISSESITDNDLITRLLEEVGTREPRLNRENKLVIRLGEKPDEIGGLLRYPDSGNYSQGGGNRKISVRKESTDVQGYDKYVHSVAKVVSVEQFYVTYERNSRFFKIRAMSGYNLLGSVTAYFENGTGGYGKPVLITFSFRASSGYGTGSTYVYKYSDFVNDLKRILADKATATSTVKEITTTGVTGFTHVGSGGGYSDSELKNRLQQESEKLKPLITFATSNRGSNEHIRTKQHNVGDGNKFIKVVMTPNTNDKPNGVPGGGGSSVGPWIVYNTRLFTHYDDGAKIPDDVLTSIFTITEVTDSRSNKYSSITVYYTSNTMALLVEFDPGSRGKKKYFKRIKGDAKWESDNNINTRDKGVSEEELTQIRIAAFGGDERDAGIGGGADDNRGEPGGNGSSSRNEGGDSGQVGDNSNSSESTGAGMIEECYVTYERNSRYFMTATKAERGFGFGRGRVDSWLKGAKIKSVTAYYKAGTASTTGHGHGTDGTTDVTGAVGNNSKMLVLIVFSLTTGAGDSTGDKLYAYKYSDFIKDLNEVRSDNKIIEKELKTIASGRSDTELQRILVEESNKLNQITFEKGGFSDNSGNKNIMTHQTDLEGQEDVVNQGNKFIKVVMTPDTSDDGLDVLGDVRGSPAGPWTVYNDYLFNKYEPNIKIQPDEVLNRIASSSSSNNRYHSITVYYSPDGVGSSSRSEDYDSSTSSTKYMALLVEFNYYDIKTYIKRLNQDGTRWAITTADSIGIGTGGDDRSLLTTLQKERERFRPLISFLKDDSRGGNKNIKTEGPSNLDKQGDVGKDYKFKKVVMTPNIKDGPGGSSIGPWKVYNSKLFNLGSNTKIEESVLANIFTGDITSSSSRGKKYKSITVYYAATGTSDYKALLVVFYTGDGRKKYIKRKDKGGETWESVPGIGISIGIAIGCEVTADDLIEIAKDANIIVASSSVISQGGPSIGSSSNPENGGSRDGRYFMTATKAGLESWSWLRRGLWSRTGSRVGPGFVSSLGRRLGLWLRGPEGPGAARITSSSDSSPSGPSDGDSSSRVDSSNGDGLGGSVSVDSGAKGADGQPGKHGEADAQGPDGAPGEKGEKGHHGLDSQTPSDGSSSTQISMDTPSSQLVTENTASNSNYPSTSVSPDSHPQLPDGGDGNGKQQSTHAPEEQQQQKSQVEERVKKQQQESQVPVVVSHLETTGHGTHEQPVDGGGGGNNGESSKADEPGAQVPGGPSISSEANGVKGPKGDRGENGPPSKGESGTPAEGGGDTAIYAGVGGGVGATGILGGGAGYAIYRYIRK